MNSKIKLISTLLYLILITWLLVDTVNGYLIHNSIFLFGSFSLGAAIRLFIVIFLIVSTILIYPFHKNIYLMLLMLGVAVCIFHYVIHILIDQNQEHYSFFKDFQNLIKLIAPILFFYLIAPLHKAQLITDKKLKTVIIVNSIILLFNLYLTYFGLGFSTYGLTTEGIMKGGTGFFFASNEVNGTLLTLLCLSLLMYKPHIVISGIVALLFFIGAVALFSKTAIIGSGIIIGASMFSRPIKLKTIFFITLMIVLFFASSFFWLDYLNNAADRWIYFIERAGNAYLIGGPRVERIDWASHIIAEYPWAIIFGFGWWTGGSAGSFENILDLLVGYGAFGLLILGMWLSVFLKSTHKVLTINDYSSKITFVSLAILLMVAFTAGHIFQSAMLAPFIALLAIYMRHPFTGIKKSKI